MRERERRAPHNCTRLVVEREREGQRERKKGENTMESKEKKYHEQKERENKV